MDTVSPEKRSWLMTRIKGRDTSPELLVRKFVPALGLRFRLPAPGLPGEPDPFEVYEIEVWPVPHLQGADKKDLTAQAQTGPAHDAED